MTGSTIPDMKEIFRQAADIAQQVPENMQLAAFNRALDLLTAQSAPSSVAGGTSGALAGQQGQSVFPAQTVNQKHSKANSADELLVTIDTTQHPAVASAGKVLDRALMVLQIALRNYGVDGLTPSEIARVLTEKFRLSTSANAVNMAIGPATTLVNRVPKGKGYEYRIMGPGEEYLAHLGSDSQSSPRSIKATSSRRVKKPKKAPAQEAPKALVKSKGTSGRPGPKQMLEKLIGEGFFSTPRDIPQIAAYLQNSLARTYKSSDLAPTLTRLLRERKLERNKNENGIFQYAAPKQA